MKTEKEEPKVSKKLVELTAEVKELYNQGQGSNVMLGKKLLEVKGCKPHGGLGKWMEENLGKGKAVRQHCNYCMRLVRKPKAHKSNPAKEAKKSFIKEVVDNVRQLWAHAEKGEVAPANACAKIITDRVNELTHRAAQNKKPAAKATEWKEEKAQPKAAAQTA